MAYGRVLSVYKELYKELYTPTTIDIPEISKELYSKVNLQYKKIKEKYPELKSTNIMKKIGEMWRKIHPK